MKPPVTPPSQITEIELGRDDREKTNQERKPVTPTSQITEI